METIRASDETTIIPFDVGTTTAVAVTFFSLGLELSANEIKKEDHLKDFPGASLIIIETSEVCILVIYHTDQYISVLGSSFKLKPKPKQN